MKFARVEVRFDTIERRKEYSRKTLECEDFIMIPTYIGCRMVKVKVKDPEIEIR